MSDLTTWSAEDGSFRVVYPLPLFHEIDFDVSEGYRRIPRGGIEIGGLLFGRVQGNTVYVEARRPIECQHAFGPSFRLSEKDLQGIREQIAAAATDSEIGPHEVVGWFIAHTRSELVLTDAEAEQFDALIPGPGKFTLLVKPEKFKPTLFAFLVRGAGGEVPRDGAAGAFLLPLPGRAGAAPMPVVAAPPARVSPPVVTSPPLPEPAEVPPPAMEDPVVPARLPAAFVAEPAVNTAPVEPRVGVPDKEKPADAPLSAAPMSAALTSDGLEASAVLESQVAETPVARRARRRAAREAEEEERVEAEPVPMATPASKPSHQEDLSPRRRRREEAKRERVEYAQVMRHEPSRSKPLLFALLAAVVLGCALGYWVYLQMPPEVLSIKLDARNGRYLVSWPPEQTRGADTVLMRIDDGEPVPIPLADRVAGVTQIPATGAHGVKVEVIARHKLRDSRGIVRFVK